MKQIVTTKGGELDVREVPAPAVRPGFVLVRTAWSLVSAGTEGAQVREGKAGLLTKVREHPEQVKQVLDKVRKDGIRAAASRVREALGQWRPLGYSLAGEVLEVGEGVEGLAPGDGVACAGAGFAVHAEIVSVPRNLVARIPDGVDPRHASFVTLGAIALHGVRRARPTLGETGLVVGLGLVGQLAVQILAANGVRVAVRDPDRKRVDLALRLGAETALETDVDPGPGIEAWTRGLGIDFALVCAATSSSEPVRETAGWLRDRGRLVVVGDVGLDLERGPLYRKEIEFTLSRSYGPGRYDPVYEEQGVDYPVGYVRWTEGRNLQAVLDLIAAGRLDVDPLVSEEIPVEEAPGAYERILAGQGGLGTLLAYGGSPDTSRTLTLAEPAPVSGEPGILVAGAGFFAKTFHLPNLRSVGELRLAGVVSGTGASARQAAEQFGAGFAGTDFDEGLARPDVDAVLICTRHGLHVPQAEAAIRAGKHVLLEKPLALDESGIQRLEEALAANPVRFAVGFNRRHAPLLVDLRRELKGTGPWHGVYRVNAGRLPADHWVNDPEEGGGRILGEACHFLDLFCFLAGGEPRRVTAHALRSPDPAVRDDDNLTATVSFADGSVFTLLYSTAGPSGFPKEQLEVFGNGIAAVLTDYRELSWTGARNGQRRLRHEDKGQAAEMEAWARYLRGEPAEVCDFAQAAISTRLTLAALEAARTGVDVTPGAGGSGG